MGHAAGSLCSQSGFEAGSGLEHSAGSPCHGGGGGGEWLSRAKTMICLLGLDLGLCL